MDKERITRHIEHVKEFSSQKKLEAVEFVRQSPLKKLQQIVRNTVHSEIDAKIQLLQKVPVFDHTSPEILRALALRCEEVQCLCGDVIVREHFLNDGLHILLEGLFIAKKSSHVMGVDPVESIHEPNFFFGEKSFLSDDIAPATISVASNTAKYLLLTKSSHDEVKGLFGESVRMICKAVVDEMPLFKTFTTAQKQNVINALVEVKFSPGTYICRQGDIGNTFYIVAEGECSVTICSRELGGADTFIAKLHNGDFFGGEFCCFSPLHVWSSVAICALKCCFCVCRVDVVTLHRRSGTRQQIEQKIGQCGRHHHGVLSNSNSNTRLGDRCHLTCLHLPYNSRDIGNLHGAVEEAFQ